MSDRTIALTVFLDEPTRTDDVQALIDAIQQMRNVVKVEYRVAESTVGWAKIKAKRELLQLLIEALEHA